MAGRDDNAMRRNFRYSNMQHFYTSGATSDNPRTCDEVPNDGLYNLDPEQDGLDPISVFCNISSTPATAVLHHNIENWTLVDGYESSGSYTAQVRFGQMGQLTHWGRDKMDAISQTTFSSAFSWMKMFEFRLKFHWSLFQRVQSTIFQHWFR